LFSAPISWPLPSRPRAEQSLVSRIWENDVDATTATDADGVSGLRQRAPLLEGRRACAAGHRAHLPEPMHSLYRSLLHRGTRTQWRLNCSRRGAMHCPHCCCRRRRRLGRSAGDWARPPRPHESAEPRCYLTVRLRASPKPASSLHPPVRSSTVDPRHRLRHLCAWPRRRLSPSPSPSTSAPHGDGH
jgi:hypothetical protein